MICYLPPKEPVLCSPARRTDTVMNYLKWAQETMLAYDTLFIPFKMFYPCNINFSRAEDKTSHKKHSKKRSILAFSSPHQSARFHAENHQARNQEHITISPYLLLTGPWCVSLADLHYLVNVHRTGGGLFRGIMFPGCPVTTIPSGRAECIWDFQSAGRREGASVDLCIRCSWWHGLPGCHPHRQVDKKLPCLWILLQPLLVSVWLGRGRKKEGGPM